MPGVPVRLSASVRRIVAPNAGLMTGPGTNTYLLGDDDVVVLDPGPNDAAHARAILDAAGNRVRWIVVTHTHRDHSPLARVLAAQTGAVVIGLSAPDDGRQDETFAPGRRPADGEQLCLGGATLTAIHTPGHASNCVCYLLAGERLLFSGDHVLEGVSPVILPPDGDMGEYLQSLEKLLTYDILHIAPGHGEVMDHAAEVVDALRAHRLRREDKVLRRLRASGGATLQALTPSVYDDVPAERHAWALFTLDAHLRKLAREGRVRESAGVWRIEPV